MPAFPKSFAGNDIRVVFFFLAIVIGGIGIIIVGLDCQYIEQAGGCGNAVQQIFGGSAPYISYAGGVLVLLGIIFYLLSYFLPDRGDSS